MGQSMPTRPATRGVEAQHVEIVADLLPAKKVGPNYDSAEGHEHPCVVHLVEMRSCLLRDRRLECRIPGSKHGLPCEGTGGLQRAKNVQILQRSSQHGKDTG